MTLPIQPEAKLSVAAQRAVARWYELIGHPVQRDLITDQVRFKVVPAGRRSGKTERAKRFVVREAFREPGPYFVAAPTRDQAKRIYWNDLKLLAFTSILQRDSVRESELIINLPNGSSLNVIGLDQPQRMEGQLWAGGIVDEIADVKSDAWQINISPALDTFDPSNPGRKAWCWLIGVPDGLNHFHDLWVYATTSGDPDWKGYTWHSADILPLETIKAAKRRMSLRQFRQEYEASFETASGRVYEEYGHANHTTEVIQTHEQIMWAHDFNFTPLSSVVCVRRGDNLYILDEIVLESAISRQSAIEFVEKFEGHGNKVLLLYGDPAGRAGEKHGHASDYTEMEQVLRSAGWTVHRRVRPAAPPIKDRQNAVRAKIANASGLRSLFVNAARCPYAHKGLSNTQIKSGSTFLEEDSETQHITTAIGYCVHYEWPVIPDRVIVDPAIVPTKNFFGRKTL
jgi:hypothetical protein